MIEYRVRLADPTRHWFEVDCRISAADATEDFELPSWIPGSYLLREYARHVVRAEAFDSRGVLEVEKLTHNVWRCHTRGGTVTLRLRVYALDESVRGAWFDKQRAWFNGPCLFVRPQNQPDAQVRVLLEAPAAPFDEWRLATAMSPVTTDERGFGEYRAENYDELLDHPVVIGNIDTIEFTVAGVPHSLVVIGAHSGDLERVAGDLQKICQTQIEFFGSSPPFDRYLFLCLAVSDGHGGLEHRSSSTLMFRRGNLPRRPDAKITKGYQQLLSLASHEYFHTWHVKRSKPAAFMPYRLAERNFTKLLWVFEGITSYYQDRFLLRSGVIDAPTYLNRVAETISNVMRVPGRNVQSLADSSFDAWDKLYKPNANSSNATVSYYSKGALVALALDLEIRRQSNSQVSLDAVLEALWLEYGARNIGLPEDGFEKLAARVSGSDLTEFFDAAIRGTDDPPLAELFEELAIDLEPQESPAGLWLGIVPRVVQDAVECVTVLDGGPAQSAGLNPLDIIIAVDKQKMTRNNMSELLQRYEVGAVVSISYFRGDELLESSVTLAASPPHAWKLRQRKTGSETQLQLRDAWLAG